MSDQNGGPANVRQAVPFFGVCDMEASLRFYVEGLAFRMTKHWIVGGEVRWCWLQKDEAAVMLQEFDSAHRLSPQAGVSGTVTICFICEDALALYREFTARGVETSTPFVGNAMWVTGVVDPDGHRLEFESPTDTPEDTLFSESEA